MQGKKYIQEHTNLCNNFVKVVENGQGTIFITAFNMALKVWLTIIFYFCRRTHVSLCNTLWGDQHIWHSSHDEHRFSAIPEIKSINMDFGDLIKYSKHQSFKWKIWNVGLQRMWGQPILVIKDVVSPSSSVADTRNSQIPS